MSYIFADRVGYHESYTWKDDMFLVAKLLTTWSTANNTPLDVSATAFITALQTGELDATAAAKHPWLA